MIAYELPGRTYVSIKVYDVFGREVATLVDGVQDAGFKSVEWNAVNIAAAFIFIDFRLSNLQKPRNLFS